MSSETLKWLVGTLLALASAVIGYLQYRRQVKAPTMTSKPSLEDIVTPKIPLPSVSTKVVATSGRQHDGGLREAIAYTVALSVDTSCNFPRFNPPGSKTLDSGSSWSMLTEVLNVKIGDCLWLCAEYTSTELLHYVHARLDCIPGMKNIAGFLSLMTGDRPLGISFMKNGTWTVVLQERYKSGIFRGLDAADKRFARVFWVPDVSKGITITHLNKNERYRLHAIAWVSPKTEQRGRIVLESLTQEQAVRILTEYADWL
jgi:hypothetical protein